MMKRKLVWLSLLTMVGLSSCDKYLDVNDNPSFPQDAKAEVLIAPIIFQMANGYSQDQTIVNKFTQAILGGSADDASKIWERHGYRSQSDVGGVMWRMVYFNHGNNLELMLKDALDNEKHVFAGIAYAVKAWGYQMLTDYHGPIILDEALRSQQLRFKYNDQDEVYAKVQLWSDSAIYYFNKNAEVDYTSFLNSERGDNLFKGNVDRWKKFVYGLKATQYNHLVNKAHYKTALVDSVIKYADLSFASSAEDAGVKFKGDKTSNANVVGPSYAVYTSSYYNRAGKPVLRYLTGGLRGEGEDGAKSSVDPRLSRMLNFVNSDSTFVGGEPNVTNTAVPNILGNLVNNVYNGKYIFKDAVDFPLMTYAQIQLIKAEAQFIKGDLAGAYTSYINAITGHMAFVNRYTPNAEAISNLEIQAYLSYAEEIPQQASDLTLADIMGQKYIVQWGWGGLEQWCDLRKYRYDPAIFKQYIQLAGNQVTYNEYCYRVRPRYNSEYAWNEVELDKWGALEPDYVTKPTWFVLPN